jgi:hypothetical protein
MPQVEQSIANLTLESNEIKTNDAVNFIKTANLHIPIIQNYFDELGAQIVTYIQLINNLIEILNEKNKILPKEPNIPLPPIQKIINHFRKK